MKNDQALLGSRLPRRWFPLWRLDGYIFREFMTKYSILLLVFIILFILNDVYNDIGDFLEANAGWKPFVTYLAYKLPGNIRFILPISMLLGCMWTMAAFGKNLEITAMRASGVSLFRCSATIFVVGAVVTAINIYFNEALVPYTENQAEILYDQAADKREHVHSLLAYRSTDARRHWLFRTFTGRGDQDFVTVKTFWTDGMIPLLLGTPGDADFPKRLEAIFPESKSRRILALPTDRQLAAVQTELRDRKIDFYARSVSYDEDKHEWVFRNGNYISYDRNDETRFSGSMGTSTMHPEINYEQIIFPKSEIPETPFDIVNAVREKDDLSTFVILDLVLRNPDMAPKVKDIYMTVFYYRLAFPWACFLAVFLGIPLATKNERTGSMLAIIAAIVMIVGYMVVAQIFLVLGKSGVLPPIIAGLTPTLLFVGYGVWKVLTDRN